MPFRSVAILVVCNVIWSATYAVVKLLLERGYQPMEISFLRLLSAALPALAYCAVARARGTRASPGPSLLGDWLGTLRRVDLRLVAVGLLSFFISPLCQINGLKLSRAIDGSVMIALEPLVTVLAACVLLGERFRARLAGALALAVVGACLVSGVSFSSLAALADTRLAGNAIFSLSMLSEAAYSAVSKPALGHRAPVLFIAVALGVGVAVTFVFELATDGPGRLAGLVPLFTTGRLTDWAGLLFLGWLGTLFGYLYWLYALKTVPVASLALTLYIQPLLGLFWGWWLAGEQLTASTLSGAALVIAAVWLGVTPRLTWRRTARAQPAPYRCTAARPAREPRAFQER